MKLKSFNLKKRAILYVSLLSGLFCSNFDLYGRTLNSCGYVFSDNTVGCSASDYLQDLINISSNLILPINFHSTTEPYSINLLNLFRFNTAYNSDTAIWKISFGEDFGKIPDLYPIRFYLAEDGEEYYNDWYNNDLEVITSYNSQQYSAFFGDFEGEEGIDQFYLNQEGYHTESDHLIFTNQVSYNTIRLVNILDHDIKVSNVKVKNLNGSDYDYDYDLVVHETDTFSGDALREYWSIFYRYDHIKKQYFKRFTEMASKLYYPASSRIKSFDVWKQKKAISIMNLQTNIPILIDIQ